MKRKGLGFTVGEPNLHGIRLADHHSERAFTLTELAVVLATTAILCGLLLPALAATHDRSSRAVCQDHLRQIGVVVTRYAGENDGDVLSVKSTAGVYVPIAISANSHSNLTQIGLDASATNQDGRCIWTCPNRPNLPFYVSFASEWIIGYEYFGGVTNWNLPVYGTVPSRSPTNLRQAKPYWALAADANIKDDSAWGHLSYQTTGQPYWDNIPPHRTGDASFPQGGNQVFCDGSVQWIDFEKTYSLISYAGVGGNRYFYFYQDPSDFDPSLRGYLPILQARP